MILGVIILFATLILLKVAETAWTIYNRRRFQQIIQEFSKEEEWLKAIKAQYDKWAEEGKPV